MEIRSTLLFAAGLALAAPMIATAQAPASKPATEAAKPSMAEGEVRKVDKDAKKITLKHGEIKALDMPAMTMVFQVKDAALLEVTKSGDKVRFDVEKVAGGYAVTKIEVAK